MHQNQPVFRLMTGFVFAFVGSAAAASILYGQEPDPAKASVVGQMRVSPPLRSLPFVGKFALAGRTAFICWPKELVDEATITAIDLETFQLKWKRVIGPRDVSICRLFRNRLYCRTHTQLDPPQSNQRTDGDDFLLSLETGEGIAEPVDNVHVEVVFSDFHLVTDRIYSAASVDAIPLGRFHRYRAAIDRGKLFEIGFTCDVEGRLTGDALVHRIDLATGFVDLTDELVALPAVLLAGREDRVILQTDEPIEIQKSGQIPTFERAPMKSVVTCYDLFRKSVLWKQTVPCRIRAARFRDDGRLECQCYWRMSWKERVKPDTVERIPLIIDIATGTYEIDRNWRDPYSFVYWYAATNAIDHATRNDRYLVAKLKNGELLCVDPTSGQLIWRLESTGVWEHFSDVWEDKIITSLPGAVEIIDVATGTSRSVTPQDLGLSLAAAMRLPRYSPSTAADDIRDARHDWLYDRLLLAAPAVPLLVWIIYRCVRWRFAGNAKNRVSQI